MKPAISRFHIALVIALLAVLDVWFWMSVDVLARMDALPDNDFGERWTRIIHLVPVWREVVYFTAGGLMTFGLGLAATRRRIGAFVFVAGAAFERLDWAFHSVVASLPETSLGYIELVLIMCAGAAILLVPRKTDWRSMM